jgi:hypothetical protein
LDSERESAVSMSWCSRGERGGVGLETPLRQEEESLLVSKAALQGRTDVTQPGERLPEPGAVKESFRVLLHGYFGRFALVRKLGEEEGG